MKEKEESFQLNKTTEFKMEKNGCFHKNTIFTYNRIGLQKILIVTCTDCGLVLDSRSVAD